MAAALGKDSDHRDSKNFTSAHHRLPVDEGVQYREAQLNVNPKYPNLPDFFNVKVYRLHQRAGLCDGQ